MTSPGATGGCCRSGWSCASRTSPRLLSKRSTPAGSLRCRSCSWAGWRRASPVPTASWSRCWTGGSPSSPFVDDNVYQQADTGVGYRWTLTEVEGGTTEPEPPPPPQPSPPGAPSAPPAPSPLPSTGTPRADTLIGTGEDDVIRGRGGNDRIFGKGGRDRLFGGAGKDRVSGGPGADRLDGGPGRDRLNGDGGADLILARGGGADTVDCGPGRDVARVDGSDRVRRCERVLGASR